MKIALILVLTIVCLTSFVDARQRWGKRQVKELAFSEEREADESVQDILGRTFDDIDRKLKIESYYSEAISYRVCLKQSNILLVKARVTEGYTNDRFPIHLIIINEEYREGPEVLAIKEVCDDDELVPFEQE